VLRLEREISRSRIIQDVILHAGSARIDFVTTIHWGDERDVMLKVAFPVSVLARTARYEVQFGNYERPTHGNTPFDWARFEVCGQRWADLSETDYGVALLNDCKYGYDIRDNVMRLTLLKAPLWPDATADINQTHTFTYSLLPHEGDFAAGGVVQAAADLNDPITGMVTPPRNGARPATAGWLSVTGDNVVIDTVKKCEDDDGLIVRLYEAHGCRGRRTLRTALPVKRGIETDLMERDERKLTVRNGRITLDFKPYQIRTVKLLMR
jgi:alpha-mannosidase